MLIKIKTLADIPSSEITPEHIYRSRREFMKVAAAGAVGAVTGVMLSDTACAQAPTGLAALSGKPNPNFVVDEKSDPLNTYEQITTYNNYYEFGTRKNQPAQYAHTLRVKPWTVKVDGLVSKPGDYGVEDLVNFNQLEERVYRHRCVEAWSMVMPFIGVPLSSVLNKVGPQPGAKFVEFTTVLKPSEMPLATEDQAGIRLPYVEGLRMDEAMHPLTLMVVGLYGKVLPNQNGAPLRVHIPWKYGFKSGKSIVRIRFTDKQPMNTWQLTRADEYGFYANVNPTVDHPRWSQAKERRLPSPFANRPTLMFNGYADQVASLYAGMDLRKYY
jgi:methionine sulfoxide reductase catalytic subunit